MRKLRYVVGLVAAIVVIAAIVVFVIADCFSTKVTTETNTDVESEVSGNVVSENMSEIAEASSVVTQTENIVSDNAVKTEKSDPKFLGDPSNEVEYFIDNRGIIIALDGSRTDGYTSDGVNVFNEVGTKVGSISSAGTESFFTSRYLQLDYEHLYNWYGWDWTPVDITKIESKDFKPFRLEYGYYEGNKLAGSIDTACVGDDPGSVFVTATTVWQYAFDGDVIEVKDNKAVTDKGTIYQLEYSGKKLTKISTIVDLGGTKYVIYYKINEG